MASQTQIFSINGLIDTSKTVWNNGELIAAAAAAWISFDVTSGQYGVVINKQEDTVVKAFNDDNIIGEISLTETDYESIYNGCEISFPNRDMFSRTDYIRYDSPVATRFDYEPDNMLTFSSDLINDPVQADVIAITELKQSRQNKVITFATDFTALAVDPGDIISLSQDYWGWNNKLFRVTTLSEEDRDDGSIVINITAIEYSDQVYAYDDIVRFDRSTSTSIGAVSSNIPVQQANNIATGVQVGAALGTDEGRSAITGAGVPVFGSTVIGLSDVEVLGLNSGIVATSSVEFTETSKMLMMIVEQPQGDITYEVYVNEVQETRVYTGNLPVIVDIEYSPNGSTWNSIAIRILDSQTGSTTFALLNQPAGFYRCVFEKVNTLDLDQDTPTGFVGQQGVVSVVSIANPFINTNGDAASLSIVQFAN